MLNKKFNFLIVFIVIFAISFVVSLFFSGEIFAQSGPASPSLGGLDETATAAGLKTDLSIAKIAGQIIYIILGFLAIVFIILLIYGGFMRMTAQGNPEQVKKSMGIITSAIIGVIIIIAAYTITAFVLSRIGASLGTGSEGENSGYNCCVDNDGECKPSDQNGECPLNTNGDYRACSQISICETPPSSNFDNQNNQNQCVEVGGACDYSEDCCFDLVCLYEICQLR